MLTFYANNRNYFINKFSKFIDIKYDKDYNNPLPFLGWNWFTNKEIFEYRIKNQLPIVCVERGSLPGSIFFDVNGFLYNSKSYNRCNWEKELSVNQKNQVEEYIRNFKSDNNKSNDLEFQKSDEVTKKAFSNTIQNKKYKKIVFIPFQLPTDTVIKHFSGFIGSHENFVKTVIDISKKNKDILFIYKNHPLKKILNQEFDNFINVDNYHFKSCLDVCDIVMCVNSGVGLQSMIYEKPALIFGDAFYEFDDINHKIKDVSQVQNLLRSENLTVNSNSMKRFIYWLNFEFYSNVDWKSIPNENKSLLININRFQIWTEKEIFYYKK